MRMGGSIPRIIEFDNLDVADVPVCSEPKCFTQVYHARLEFCLLNANGTVCVTLETSIDGSKWIPHNECSMFLLDREDTGIKIGTLDGLFYRICLCEDSATATEGILQTRMLLKDH